MRQELLIGAAVVLAALYLANRQQLADDMADQETSTFEDVLVTLDPSTYDTPDTDTDTMQTNLRAFLDMIAYAEGTGDNYNVMFGWPSIAGRTFDSYDDHPRQLFAFTDKAGRTLKTSAAGRYQFLARTWDSLQSKLDLPDFSPWSQDQAALELIRQRGALNDAAAGRVAVAVAKCAPIWASLPGAGYAQPERKLSSLISAFQNNGGTVTA